MIDILLCDDHPLVLEGLRMVLDDVEDISVKGCAFNGKEALKLLETNKADIILLDVNMPVLNGIETLKILQKEFPEVSPIMLSMLNDVPVIKQCIRLGCKAYLMKNAGPKEIIDTIRTVASGGSSFDEALLLELLQLKKQKAKKKRNKLFPKLSRREREILALITEEYTTSEIAEKLFISFGTVETHRRNMLNKLGLRNTAGLVRTAFEFDLLQED